MGSKNQKVVVWGVGVQVLVVRGAIRRNDGSLGGWSASVGSSGYYPEKLW